MFKKIVSAAMASVICMACVVGTPTKASAEATAMGVSYAAYVQNHGWMGQVSGPQIAGTQGKSLRMQAFTVSLTNPVNANASITYQAYMQSYGWISPVSSGAEGITNQPKRIEAVRLTINNLPEYQVAYRVQQQSYGWSDWVATTNGTSIQNAVVSGITGKSKRIEAIEIYIMPDFPDMTDSQFENYLNNHYASLTDDGVTMSFNWRVNMMTLTDSDENVFAFMDGESYSNWTALCHIGRQSDLISFLNRVDNDILYKYGNKTFFGAVVYKDELPTYPSEFPASEITYDNSTGEYQVAHFDATMWSGDGQTASVDIKD